VKGAGLFWSESAARAGAYPWLPARVSDPLFAGTYRDTAESGRAAVAARVAGQQAGRLPAVLAASLYVPGSGLPVAGQAADDGHDHGSGMGCAAGGLSCATCYPERAS
jgi:hypothetical protein